MRFFVSAYLNVRSRSTGIGEDMSLQNLTFVKKIAALLALPILAFLWLSVNKTVTSYQTYSNNSELQQMVELSVVYSNLVHELQKERGATAGFLGSKGTKFVTELAAQRQQTDKKNQTQKRFLQETYFSDPKVNSLINNARQELAKLEQIRSQVSSQQIQAASAIGFYTALNKKLLSVSELIVALSQNAEVSRELISYYNFIQGKERAGVERAVLSNTFAVDKFAPNVFARFVSLVSEQNTYINNFVVLGSPTLTSAYERRMDNPAVREVERLRTIAREHSIKGNFGVDSVHWFKTATDRINLLKQTEDNIANQLQELSNTLISKARNAVMTNVVMAILIFLVIVGLVTFVTKDMLVQVKNLTSVMSKMREQNDLTVRTSHKGTDEISEIGRALNLTLEKFGEAISHILGSSNDLATSAGDTSQTVQRNNEIVEEQLNAVTMIATAAEELTATSQGVAENTSMAADSAKHADETAKSGMAIVRETYNSIEALRSEIDSLATTITSLNEKSTNITNVIDVIKSVSEQTNLLALNAAIEAARAGEQGRGFAVVADEVRTLAQRTQNSTSEIESIISELLTESNQAFSVIDRNKSKAVEAVNKSKEAEVALREISEAISKVSEQTEHIAVAAEQQLTVTQDVSSNVVAIEQKASEVALNSKQIEEATSKQSELASNLQELAITYKV